MAAYSKPKRKVDEALLETVRTLPCIACNKAPPSDAHHLKTVGSGGGDEYWNVISVCRTHHQDFHRYGIVTMSEERPSIAYWLDKAGWTRGPFRWNYPTDRSDE